jgi:hypothetical protein
MSFDHRLGPALPSTNALRLMQIVGLIVRTHASRGIDALRFFRSFTVS